MSDETGREPSAIGRLEAELTVASAALRRQMASWEYAFAMAGGFHGGSDHPTLRAARDEAAGLERRCTELRALLAEHRL